MAAQMIFRASGRVGGCADSLSAVACNGTVAALKVEVAAAGATAGLYVTRGAFRALAIACGALGLVGGAAYLWYSKGVGLTKYLLSPATHRPPRHVRQRANGQKEEWRGTRLRNTRETRRLTKK